MNNKKIIHWVWLGLVICLLDAAPAHAFYNPQQGAGGVGGLLMVNDQSTINAPPSTHVTAYDGNGNVAELVNANDGTLIPSTWHDGGWTSPHDGNGNKF